MQDILPIGSIVTLQNSTKKLLIYGRCQAMPDDDEVFDYLACPYPEGYINPELSVVFNHAAIQHVVHVGYQDEEETDMRGKISEFRQVYREKIYNKQTATGGKAPL